jgi:rSAM/selenodomain-associated transferase 2
MRTIQEQIRVSVITPVLDAAADVTDAVRQVADCGPVAQIVVVDGGSRDDTVALAMEAGAQVVEAPRGRGSQLARGAQAATGDWLLFLHADCRLDAGWEDAVLAFVTAPGAESRAGYFALALDDEAPAARRLERLVSWRCRWLALPYGDQGLLISRALYDAAGGYKAIPLMEDVDLVRRLGRARLRPIDAAITASAARYRSGGYWRRSLRNLFCLALYFLGVSPGRIGRIYG